MWHAVNADLAVTRMLLFLVHQELPRKPSQCSSQIYAQEALKMISILTHTRSVWRCGTEVSPASHRVLTHSTNAVQKGALGHLKSTEKKIQV